MLNENENIYLAKWLNNDLSAEELEELKALPEYDEYKKIVDGLTFFNPPSFDVQKSLKTTITKLDAPKKGKVIKLKPVLYAISAAASIVLIIGLFFNKVTHTADPGQQIAVVLPDGSSVNLNASSTLSHQRFFWSSNRNVTLNGEAFFKVAKGTNFSVSTPLGTVEVLGTQFNVKGRSDEFLVGCYEGKVRVSSLKNQKKILKKGDAVSLKNEELISRKIKDITPLWMQGESLFDSIPLKKVLDELERQYSITFKREAIDQDQLFTGGFNYKDLKIALESVLVPMEIEYIINGNIVSLSPR
ncbi:FecR family protein [Aquimarina mytili]|uniref:FecR domain-containing protein n=1 Tax=Aquimarina mytili TaxID=874423 RepID=A0A937DC58_9FLAO|nr:FecR domain-containing protein [Aquimarina mytili]MBL0684581.1 FecR domain-containing protein [Aquimarina mytili]